jgi:GMP synthase-like glutamine amidotransferase
LKSRIKSGIAGSTIVSPYIVIRPRQLRITNVVHAERLMLVCFSMPVIAFYLHTYFLNSSEIPEVGNVPVDVLTVKKLVGSLM